GGLGVDRPAEPPRFPLPAVIPEADVVRRLLVEADHEPVGVVARRGVELHGESLRQLLRELDGDLAGPAGDSQIAPTLPSRHLHVAVDELETPWEVADFFLREVLH